MDAGASKRDEKSTSTWEKGLAWVGAFLFFGTNAGVIAVYFLDIHLEPDLLWAGAIFGFFVGYALFYFPEYRHLHLWSLMAASLPFALAAAMAIVLHSVILALICGFIAFGFQCVAVGLRGRKSRYKRKPT